MPSTYVRTCIIPCIQIAAGDNHCAALSASGDLYTIGSKACGKLGRGRNTPTSSRSVTTVGKVDTFHDADGTQLDDIKIGYVRRDCLILPIIPFL